MLLLWILLVVGSLAWLMLWSTFRNIKPIEHFTPGASHLIVIMHGFHSTPGESRWIAPQILKNNKNVSILRTAVTRNENQNKNWWWQNYACTQDGTEVSAERCLAQIHSFVKLHNGSLRKISFIGQSLGGLYGKHLVKEVRTCLDLAHLEPGVFITLASPNLGCRQHLMKWYGWIPYFLSKYCWGKTGLELMEHDDFLANHAHSHMNALSHFKKICYLAPGCGDIHVPLISSLAIFENGMSDWQKTIITRCPGSRYKINNGHFLIAHSCVAAGLPCFAAGQETLRIILTEISLL